MRSRYNQILSKITKDLYEEFLSPGELDETERDVDAVIIELEHKSLDDIREYKKELSKLFFTSSNKTIKTAV